MSTEEVLRGKAKLYFGGSRSDVVHANELYHDDAVLEFPQSGERFEGRDRFTDWRSQHPGVASHELQRLTVRHDLVIAEGTVLHAEGEPTMHAVVLLDFRGDRAARERVYVMEGWEAPAWRRPWRSP